MVHNRITRPTGTVLLDGTNAEENTLDQTFFRLDVTENGNTLFSGLLSRDVDGVYRFGSNAENEIVLGSKLGIVSRFHGKIEVCNSQITVCDENSTNGVYVNGEKVRAARVSTGDVVSIGEPKAKRPHVLFSFNVDCSNWTSANIAGKTRIDIGRLAENDVVLPSPAVSAHHATLTRRANGKWILTDHNSFNGTFLKGAPVTGQIEINDGEIVTVANATIVVSGNTIYHDVCPGGVEVVARDLTKTRPIRGGKRTVTDHVSLKINKGAFCAIVGGSGAGKTTLLNELNGTSPANSGSVTVNGVDLYSHYGILKNAIGYVPQQDIVYDNLKLLDMLIYEAELRMPPDCTHAEHVERAEEVLDMLELSHESNNFVKSLSGGQKKRASIAVELLADPKLLFLDEPTSGLDPGTEKSLMTMMAAMAHAGRTVIVVTHTTQNIHLCDQVVMLGVGGKLCYSGPTLEACQFFGVEVFTDIYTKVKENPILWENAFRETSAAQDITPKHFTKEITRKKNPSWFSQFLTLTKRLNKLILNDAPRLVLLIGQAPLLGWLIGLVSGSECFNLYEDAKAGMFALLCSCIWVGLLNSIQEVCKERTVLEREFAGGLNLSSYVCSKVVVLGFICIIQTVLLTETFIFMCGLPDACLFNTHLEFLITIFLTTFSSMCVGLLVSCLFNNSDRALAMAPLLIMPQVLFSGFLFKLEGAMEKVSVFVQCKWGMEALGTSADLNGMPLKIYENEMITPEVYEHEFEAAFEFALSHLTFTWGILLLFSVASLLLCHIALRLTLKRGK